MILILKEILFTYFNKIANYREYKALGDYPVRESVTFPFGLGLGLILRAKSKQVKFLLLFFSLLMLSGCFPTLQQKPIEKKQYLFALSPLPAKTNNTKAQNIVVYPVTSIAAFDQNNFLYRLGPSRYSVDYYNSFVVSPAHQLDNILNNYLKHAGNWHPIFVQETSGATKELRIQIVELYADYRDRNHPKAVISLNCSLTEPRDKQKIIVLDKTFRSAVSLKTKDTDSLLTAWSLGLKIDMAEMMRSLSSK